jgi:hypothetical protein
MEFAVQGLDTWAVQEKLKDISAYKRKILLPVALLPLAYGIIAGKDTSCLFIETAAVLIAIYAIYDFTKRKTLFVSHQT